MNTHTDVELPIEHIGWHWTMRRRRLGNRRRIEGDIAARWLRRFVGRHAVTLTDDPVVSLVDDCVLHWHLGAPCLTLSFHGILGGQRFGLPERFYIKADAIPIVPDEPIEVAR